MSLYFFSFLIFESKVFELQMYQELQLLSPLVPTRHFYFIRYCQQIEQGVWAVVDVSYNIPRENQIVSHPQCHRFPSGCLIQDMPNGYSKVLPPYLSYAFLFIIETSYFLCPNISSHWTMLIENRLLGLSM